MHSHSGLQYPPPPGPDHVGLRLKDAAIGEFGIELAPEAWGRYRLAFDVIEALLEYGFRTLLLQTICGASADGNRRVERLARAYAAQTITRRDGPEWMSRRGWQEVDWALARSDWLTA